MNTEELHRIISESKGNESNICQISAIRGGETVYDVTIRHLLTMTAPYKGRSEPWKKVCTSSDWTKAALDFLGGRGGISGEFRYATLGIQILAGIIERATEEKCIDFANRNLFIPLGIPEHTIHGDSGNIIYVNKALDISIGITGTFKPRIFDRVEFIEKTVLPSIL